MKFIHLSDLHIGKVVNSFLMLDDQKYIIKQILEIVENEKPDAVLISGDIYDKGIPSAEAVVVLNDFLKKLSDMPLELFVIYGNHDSAERLSFGNGLFKDNVHFSKVFDGTLQRTQVCGVNIYMLPFVKPLNVKVAFKDDEDIEKTIGNDYSVALRYVFEKNGIDREKKNVLLSHQFVSGAVWSGSEDSANASVGGTDNISADVFDAFDYVALGHIHGAQNVTDTIRYCGSPLKYSMSEKDKKSVTVVTLDDALKIEEVPLVPKREWRNVEGTFEELYRMEKTDDYISVALTDTTVKSYAYDDLRSHVFPNIIGFKYENILRGRDVSSISTEDIENKSMFELFKNFYKEMMGVEMGEEDEAFILKFCEEAEGENE